MLAGPQPRLATDADVRPPPIRKPDRRKIGELGDLGDLEKDNLTIGIP